MNQQLRELQAELQQLKDRVAFLEKQIGVSGPSALKQPVLPQRELPIDGQNERPPVRPSLPPKKTSLKGMSEEKLAGTWFNRLGILAIMLAVAFFLKWSFDNYFIGELGRIVIGLVIGLGFLGTGEYFQRKKFVIYGQGFTGGGIAILYFSIFSAFVFYHLISQPVAFVLMILITLAASLLSIRYDSPAVGIIGIVGGFATPFLLITGQISQVVLFTYVAILDAGVLLVAYFKKWPIFNYLTFLFTYMSFIAGHISSPEAFNPLCFNTLSFSYLTLFFLIYLAISFTRNIRLKESFLWADISLILLNAIAYFSLSYQLLVDHIEGWIGFWAVFLGLIYLIMGVFIYRRYPGTRSLSLTLLALAAGFITLAIPLQLDGYWVTISWALEAVIIFYLNLKINPQKIPLAGFLILSFAIISLFTYPFTITGEELWVFLNKAAVAFLFVIIATASIVWLFYRHTRKFEAKVNSIFLLSLQVALNLLIIIFLTLEINAYYDYLWSLNSDAGYSQLDSSQNLILSLVWGLHAAILVVLGFWRRLKGIRWFGLGFLGIVILKVFLYDLSNLSTPYRILSFMGLGIILLAISWIYHRYKNLIVGDDDFE
ncbi:MAG TPA: DUF2339 domain-containing protein [Desulfitobacterium dehalogenans]|uniref:DUF2339 domain-containing protein n=1 Tax=Desulfitobacterium dehalogenans TaxID=36854 RepID=A0A7C6Z3I4_9FIRM|nr:DUF2339 domain-containing protein [Desulfitobacterium dehalogenans]